MDCDRRLLPADGITRATVTARGFEETRSRVAVGATRPVAELSIMMAEL